MWQGRASMNTIRSVHSAASAVIYDASRVSLTGQTGGVTIRTRSSLATLPMPELNETVEKGELPDALERVDAQFRRALPPLFTSAFDDWARRGYALEPMPSLGRVPSGRLSLEEMRAGMTTSWAGDISQVHPDEAEQTVQAVVYDRIPVVLAIDSTHGQVNGSIVLDDGHLAHCFGTWLLADHPDMTGLRRVCELIDRWARLRLGLSPK